MERKRIREVIVVEGHHDTEKLRKYYDCDTIETSGTHLGKAVMDRIREAQKKRGVIIFTDPDSPGNRIRDQINKAIPDCKNAFVDKKDAHTTRKVGVEHAQKEALDRALGHLVTFTDKADNELTMQDMIELCLSGNENSFTLREKTGEVLHIGMGNARTMLHRMNYLGITKEELKETVDKICIQMKEE